LFCGYAGEMSLCAFWKKMFEWWLGGLIVICVHENRRELGTRTSESSILIVLLSMEGCCETHNVEVKLGVMKYLE